MGKRSAAARNRRRRIKRRFARQKAKLMQPCFTRGSTQSSVLERLPSDLVLPSETPEDPETQQPEPPSFHSSVPSHNSADWDIDQWSASSPPSSPDDDGDRDTDLGNEAVGRASLASCVWKATEEEFPMIVESRRHCIQVHLSPSLGNFGGSEVLRLSTEEYFRRIQERERRKNLTIKCLRNKVEELNKDLVSKEHTLRKEKEEAVCRVRSFWRDNILEGCSHGGRMVRAALQHSMQSEKN